ncbi:MAG: nuclear transport factor 2 family protein [Gammaproteobacteria bacterium]|nr:nuclear transport factor 2 family protein [Gammaproteobacteria bacterium]
MKTPTIVKNLAHVSLMAVSAFWVAVATAEASQTEQTRAWTQQYFERLSAADASVSDFWADDIVLFVNNHGPWGGHYGSKASVTQYYRDMASMFDLEKGLTFELLQTVVEGNHSSIRFRVQGQHKSGAYDNHYMQVYTWNEDGKLSRIENFYGWGPFAEFHRQALAKDQARQETPGQARPGTPGQARQETPSQARQETPRQAP